MTSPWRPSRLPAAAWRSQPRSRFCREATSIDTSRSDGTLQFPLGYRNANGAFFCIVFWPALGLATLGKLPWWARGIALGLASLCLELALLSQSRGSSIGFVVAAFAYLACVPRRTVALGWLALAALPALLVIGHLSPLYHAALDRRPLLQDLHDAARHALTGAVIAVVAGAVVALIGGRRELS